MSQSKVATVLTWNTEGTTTRKYRAGVIGWLDDPSAARPCTEGEAAVRRSSRVVARRSVPWSCASGGGAGDTCDMGGLHGGGG